MNVVTILTSGVILVGFILVVWILGRILRLLGDVNNTLSAISQDVRRSTEISDRKDRVTIP
jgi:hypothetical protein